MLFLFGFAMVQIFGTAARAAAIRRHAGVEPVIGLIRRPIGLPHLHVDTGGAAERAPRAPRLRLVGSGLTSMADLAAVSALLCLLSWRARPFLVGQIGKGDCRDRFCPVFVLLVFD